MTVGTLLAFAMPGSCRTGATWTAALAPPPLQLPKVSHASFAWRTLRRGLSFRREGRPASALALLDWLGPLAQSPVVRGAVALVCIILFVIAVAMVARAGMP